MPSVPRLVEMGMVPGQAREVIDQFANTVPRNSTRFVERGVPCDLATELTAQAGGTKNARRLIDLGMAPDLAREVVN